MTALEALMHLLKLPAEWFWGFGLAASGLLTSSYWLGRYFVLSNARQQVETAGLTTALVNQRCTSLSEDLETKKHILDSRNLRVQELESECAKLLRDLESARSNGGGDASLEIVKELKLRIAKFDELREALLGAEEEVWRLRGDVPARETVSVLRASKPRILTVANLKGGVGKTTIATNLGAHFSIVRGMRVLLVDLDYQGSLTGTLLTATKNQLGSNILADSMLSGEVGGRWLVDVPRDLGVMLPGARLVTCGAVFDRFENQVMMRWLVGDIGDDVRYRLARLIASPEVQKAYDVIIIDGPPRTSLGLVNALATSHAVLVPTVPDSLSVDAVGRFLGRLTKLRSTFPVLETALVVPSLTQESRLREDEKAALLEAKLALSNWSGSGYITEAFIRHFPTLSKVAGREVGYVSDKRYVKPAFDRLGNEVAERLGIK